MLHNFQTSGNDSKRSKITTTRKLRDNQNRGTFATVQLKKFHLSTFQSKDTNIKYRRLFKCKSTYFYKAVNIDSTDKERILTAFLSTK